MQNCSLKCKDELCNNVDGSCICRIGNQGFIDCSKSESLFRILKNINEALDATKIKKIKNVWLKF